MTLGAGSRCQESTVITFEWDLMGLKEIFETSRDDEKSPLIASSPFGGGKWQLHFYASAARAQSCSLYLAAVPTPEELRGGAQACLSQGGWPREGAHWCRRGPFRFTFEIKSLDGTIPIVARGPHEPMTRKEFTNSVSTWGYPQYVRRSEIYGDRAIAKANNGVKIICTMTYPLSPLPYSRPPPTQPAAIPTDVLESLVDLFDNPDHSDVVFKFPTRFGTFRSIFASKRILARRSEYFKNLFEGGFAEGTPIGGTVRAGHLPGHSLSSSRRSSGLLGASGRPSRFEASRREFNRLSRVDYDQIDSDDSDDESDYQDSEIDIDEEEEMEVEQDVETEPVPMPPRIAGTLGPKSPIVPLFSSRPDVDQHVADEQLRAMTPESVHSSDDECPKTLTHMHHSGQDSTALYPSMQTIVIKDTSYITYRAMLFALYTDQLVFAPFSSTYHNDRAAALKKDFDFPYSTRRQYVRSRLPTPKTEAEKKAPFPISPKSMYKLADKLNLPMIKQRAFEAIKDSLNPHNVATEVFATFSSLFPEVRKVETEYMLNHWEEVSHSDAIKFDLNPFASTASHHQRGSQRRQPLSTTANQELFILLLQALRPRSRKEYHGSVSGLATMSAGLSEEMRMHDRIMSPLVGTHPAFDFDD
ncbi:hypothetical protein FRC02_000729 [Tulasnella sp. 418]|nr:hypothetical protein FRC02_000729 [Tulasnella sp. 418]